MLPHTRFPMPIRPLPLALFLATQAVALGSAWRASAQTPDPAAVQRADAAFQQGRAAARDGRWAEACAKFAESLQLDPAPGTTLNLAECEEKQGHLVRAFELLQQVARESPTDDRRLAFAKQRIEAL